MEQIDEPVAQSVALREDNGLPWRPVSRRLITARSITLAISLSLLVVPLVVVAVLWTSWAWVPVGLLALGWLWGQWLVVRQVPAISYAELPDEIAIRRGRVLRQLVTIPYGRIQYVDLDSGPLLRQLGLANIEVHTASPSSSGQIPGLPGAEAEALRERLAAGGEAQRAGL